MSDPEDEEQLLREVALQSATSIFLARRRAEEALARTQEALERKTQELAHSLALMRATLESTTDGILVTDGEGRVTDINRNYVTMWRIPAAVLEARDHGALLESCSRQFLAPQPFLAQIAAIYASSPPESYDLLELADGRVFERFSRIQLVEGRNVGRVWSFRDVTERRRAEETLRRQSEWLRVTMASIGDAVITTDTAGCVTSLNPVAEILTGWTEAEAQGQPLERVFCIVNEESRRPVENPATRSLREGQIVGLANHTLLIARDGTERAIDDSAAPIRDNQGTVIGVVLIFRDVSERRQDEERLRQSEAQFRQLADAMPPIVWAARPDGFIDYYNERWYEYTGFGREAYGDASWEPILHPDDLPRCRETYYQCIRSGEPYQIEYRFKDRRTGGYRWFLGRAFPARNEQGEIVRWFGTCTDIEDTKRNEESTRFLADASAALAELTDYASTLQKVAALAVPTFADWCAVDMRAADGSLSRLAVTHSEPAKTQLAYELFRRYPPQPGDPHGVMNVLRTGEPEWAAVIPDGLLAQMAQDAEHLRIARELGLKSYLCVPLKSRTGVLGTLTFVTAESGRVFDADDLQAAEDLAHRAVIAIENANLLAALKDSDRRKDEFLAILAHELRNPLAPIRNAVQILQAQGPAVPELEWARALIDRQVAQMSRLVDDLLDVSRITRGKLDLRKERVELRAVVNDAVAASHSHIERAGHTLTVAMPPEPIFLEADPTRLAQVLLNLLDNAAKYTERGGRIGLTAKREAGQVVIRVQDTGVGIPADMLPQIFTMFTQVDRSLERSEGGLGIGLTLVQRLVTMHGGTVEAHSRGPGQGSEFIVRLPVVAGAGEHGAGPAAPDERTAPACRILVVDDNRDAAESLALLLGMLGHEVHTAHDGLEAVEAAFGFRPHVVLLDIGLPKLNGYEVARRMKEQQEEGVVIVALTGWGQEEDRRRSREAGFDHHMTKPAEFDVLRKLLAELPPPSAP